MRRRAAAGLLLGTIALVLASDVAASAAPVRTETQLRRAWSDPDRTRVDLGADIVLRDCSGLEPLRESPYPIVVHGHGHTIRQSCFERRLLRQDGTGHVALRDIRLTRGGADGPGAAVTTRGELTVSDSLVDRNLAEEPGGGLFSMRRVTVRRSQITGNLANDDGGGVYARRGGVRVYDSVISTNLVDGSGGAIGSTGDILVVRSQVSGNTTDGDGGALYTDEDGDVTVIGSVIDGNDADGPGGAIFTLDGDVALLDTTLIGNRADDRGGAISAEADVLVVNSTVARNLAVAHVGGGIWARGDAVLVNATVTDNYAEGLGGGILSAGRTWLLSSTVSANIASVAANLGSSGPLRATNSIVGPAQTDATTGDARPTRRSCRVVRTESGGHNFVTDTTCGLGGPADIMGEDPRLRRLEDDPRGFVLTPFDGSPVRDRIPASSCVPALPSPLPAGQLLEPFVNWQRLLRRDARGTDRASGGACDIGAVESPPPPAEPPPPPPVPPAAAPPVTAMGRAARAGAGRRPAQVAPLARRVAALSRAARRIDRILACTSEVPVDQAGDPRHRWGFAYDERDGTGLDHRQALVRHRGRGRPDLRFLRLSRAKRCLSAIPQGTARAATSALGAASPATLRARIDGIERRVRRFDRWESCLTWLPVTEAGDRFQDLGYLRRSGTRRHDAAIDLDTSEWDDPDYELLAFVGRDAPGAECRTEPGEGFTGLPRAAAAAARAPGLAALEEDVEDLVEPVADITRFDECLYTVGVRSRGGYAFRGPDRRDRRRAALSFDLGPGLPQMDLMAFPGEEPPQIECNEDAGDQDTEE
jgi:hypothetical protein